MSDDVLRALTKDEWEILADALEPLLDATDWGSGRGGSAEAAQHFERLSKIAEGFRGGQPFGFTREDVAAIREAASELSFTPNVIGEKEVADLNVEIDRLLSIADRIEVLFGAA